MIKTDRHNVARIAFDETASNAAWGIYSSIVKNFNNINRHIVEAAFPFVGKTDLQVCGKWFRQSEIWHFLVYFIETCSYPLPYEQLIWGIEGEKEVNDDSQNGKEEQLIERTLNENQDERKVGSEDEPDLKSIFSEAAFDGQKFTDLKNKEDEKRLKSESTENGVHYKVITKKTDESRDLSTGAGTFGSSSKQGLIIKIGENEEPDQAVNETITNIPAGWELFTGILDELEREPQISTKIVKFLTDSDFYSKSNIANGIYFPVSLNGKRTNWSFLDKTQTHRRQAMIAEILIGKRFFYLFDTEVKPDDVNDRYSMVFIYKDDYTQIKEEHWRILLSDAVKFRGGKRNEWRWHNAEWQNFRHDLKDVEKYAERLLDFAILEIRNKIK